MRRVVAVLALLLPLVSAGSASACACCAERGTWYEGTTPFDSTTRGELRHLRFTTARYFATQEGTTPAGAFRVTATLAGSTWRLQIGSRGTLTLSLPATATTFGADIHDGKQGSGGGPLLYKEFRFDGRLRATGRLHGSHYALVLQGRGNNCLNATDFRAWHLDVSGPRQFQLYGGFR